MSVNSLGVLTFCNDSNMKVSAEFLRPNTLHWQPVLWFVPVAEFGLTTYWEDDVMQGRTSTCSSSLQCFVQIHTLSLYNHFPVIPN